MITQGLLKASPLAGDPALDFTCMKHSKDGLPHPEHGLRLLTMTAKKIPRRLQGYASVRLSNLAGASEDSLYSLV